MNTEIFIIVVVSASFGVLALIGLFVLLLDCKIRKETVASKRLKELQELSDM